MEAITFFIRKHITANMSERGASLVEYALLVALIAVVCITAVTFLGGAAGDKLSEVGSAVSG